MICPHCGIGVNLYTETAELSSLHGGVGDPIVELEVGFCPECDQPIITMRNGIVSALGTMGSRYGKYNSEQTIYPVVPNPRRLSDHIPEKFKTNFHEAEQVLPFSAKASATLSRYLLQMVLHEELNIKKRTLDEELQELEKLEEVPSKLVTVLQIMRKVANFGAHPKKNTHTCEIVEVEPKEAEVMLDLLLEVFDYVFVKPAQKQEFIKTAKEKYGVEV